jgi:hypothetical protein
MRKGRCVNCGFVHRPVRVVLVAVVGGERCSSLSIASWKGDKADGGSLRWRISLRTANDEEPGRTRDGRCSDDNEQSCHTALESNDGRAPIGDRETDVDRRD